MIWRGLLRFSVALAGVFVGGCVVGYARLVDFGVAVLELDFSFGSCFCLKLSSLKEQASGRPVSIVDVTGDFLRVSQLVMCFR